MISRPQIQLIVSCLEVEGMKLMKIAGLYIVYPHQG